MSNFFPFLQGSSPAAPPPAQRSLLKRILFFATALLLLWVALQLKPSPAPLTEASRLFSDESGSVAAREEPSPAGPRYGTLLAGAFLLGLIGFAYYRYRRIERTASTAPPRLEPLDRHVLGPGQELHIVRCDHHTLLLGVTPHGISVLERLSDASPAPPPAPEKPESTPARGDFSTFLYRAIRSSSQGN